MCGTNKRIRIASTAMSKGRTIASDVAPRIAAAKITVSISELILNQMICVTLIVSGKRLVLQQLTA